MLLPAWLAHTIVNDFLMFSIQAGGELGLTGVSESLSSLSCHGVCVCSLWSKFQYKIHGLNRLPQVLVSKCQLCPTEKLRS